MQATALASGSKGNAILIEDEKSCLLVDAGISARRIEQSLKALHKDAASLSGIVITHEHGDHIKGLPTLCKKYALPIYARPATFKAMSCYDKLPQECLHPLGDSLDLGSFHIEPFSILHDAASPVGYTIENCHQKCAIATDFGFVTSSVQAALADSDILILEANYDLDMLKKGCYPFSLKRRILSNRGHLSNEEAVWTLSRLPGKKPRQVLLAHMSEENNCPEAIMRAVEKILGKPNKDKCNIQLAKQNEMVSCQA